MERGLLWLPLLILFFGLAWSGWNEYRKVEVYGQWAAGFDRAKYDIYSVLGIKDNTVTWGKPTRKGIRDVSSFSLTDVKEIRLLIDDKPADTDNLPSKGKAAIEFVLSDSTPKIVPFTEIDLASRWTKFLEGKVQKE